MYLSKDLMRWTVDLEIRIPDGTTITEFGDDLEAVLVEMVQRTLVWLARNRPDYLDGEKSMLMNLKGPE